MKNIFFIILVTGFFLQSCEEEYHNPVNEGGTAPEPVLNARVTESLPGGAKISYQLPKDKNILYVKAQAEIREGLTREIKASLYSSELIIDGFADTTEYVVYLYTVGRNNLESEGVSVKVKPDTPPVWTVFKSIKESVSETFGGFKFSINNPSEANMRIIISTPDSVGNMVTANAIYTSVPSDEFSVRGYDSIPRLFSFCIQDRWGNEATFDSIFAPWFEEKLDKKKFLALELPGDMTRITASGNTKYIEYAWDEKLTDDGQLFQTTGTTGVLLPHKFAFDLGVKARLSRVVVHGRLRYGMAYSSQTAYVYNAGAPKEWRIFGSNEPNPDGSWDVSWIPMRSAPCVSFKPSGLPLGEFSEEDYQRQMNGEEFDIDDQTPVRYLRWSVDKVWGGASYSFFNIAEITIYGQIIKD